MGSSARILVVDDEETIREMMADLLALHDHEVVSCADAEAGLQKYDASGPFDLIVTDLTMPGMTGLEMVAKLRERGDDVAVLLMTAFGSAETSRLAFQLQVSGYLFKPFDDLTAVVREVESILAWTKSR